MRIFPPLENAKTNPIKPNFKPNYAKTNPNQTQFQPKNEPNKPNFKDKQNADAFNN